MKFRILTIGLALLIFLSSLIYGIVNNNTNQEEKRNLEDGYVDLTSWDFEEDGNAKLNTTWEIYFNQFISPNDFKSNQQLKPAYINLPANKLSFKDIKPFDSDYFYATLRTKVKIKNPSEIMGIKASLILSSYKIYVDGHLLGEIGKVGNSKDNSTTKYKNLVAFFEPKNEEIEIVIHASDFHLGDCIIAPLDIGYANNIHTENKFALSKELFLFGILFIIGIYHLGLYYKRRKDKSPLYFSILCFIVSLRMLLVGERFIIQILDLPHEILSRLGYLTAYSAPIAIAGFLYYTLDGLFPKRLFTISLYTSIFFSISTLVLEYKYYNWLTIPFTAFILIFLIYCISKLIIGFVHHWEYADHVLFGLLLFGIAIINDIIYQFVLINKGSMVPFGVAAFTITQAFTLASKFSKAFSTAEQLTLEKEEILLDLKNANTTLEMRVEERTKELTNTLQELDLITKTDYLTKLPNRRYMYEIMNERINNQKEFFIVLGDIDHFKAVNDHYGHNVGDEILVLIGNILENKIKGKGMACRWGGEEFLLIVDEMDQNRILNIIEEIRSTLESTKVEFEGMQIGTTMTFGISRYSNNMNIDHCISIADLAMYRGKEIGRNRIIYQEVMG